MKRLLYRWFSSFSAFQYRLDRRFTRAGSLALGVLGAAVVIGLDTNRTVGYQVFTLVLALVVLAAAASLVFRGRFTARRILPRFASVGVPATYRVAIANWTGRRQEGLALMEELTDPRPSFEEFVTAREPGEERRNWFDRRVGYPRWAWLVAQKRGAVVTPRPLPPLAPTGETEVALEITPLRRGHLRFEGLTIARPDPLGLVHALKSIALPQSLLVLPRRYPMAEIRLSGTRKYQPGGVALASSVGDSEEFVSLRDYRSGDPMRRIHWKSWARVGRPVVKEYVDEFFVRHALVLDTFTGSPGDAAFEDAVSAAASIAISMETQESLLDLMFVGPEAYCFTAGRGVGHTERLLEVLACVGPCRDKAFRTLHHAVIERHDSLSGCVCVLLGWDDARQELVRHLEALGTPTRVFVVAEGAALDALPRDVHRLEVGRIGEGLARL
ncbi:MAG TPA: DUF58 domain-containing protein [Candidatus Binatia bacterium]|nr:DUF58 domain-containing protein [Candidatus Binatia bacterium]